MVLFGRSVCDGVWKDPCLPVDWFAGSNPWYDRQKNESVFFNFVGGNRARESLIFEEVLGVMALAFAIFLLISDKSRKYEHEEENTPKDWLVVAPLYIPGILSCLAYAVSYIARAWTHYTGNTGLWNPCERDGGGVLLLDTCDSF